MAGRGRNATLPAWMTADSVPNRSHVDNFSAEQFDDHDVGGEVRGVPIQNRSVVPTSNGGNAKLTSSNSRSRSR